MDYNEIFQLENEMWQAAKERDSKKFLDVVSEDAVLVCGAYRCTGKEYSEIVAVFDCCNFKIGHFEIVYQDEKSIQVHYVITTEVSSEENKDLAGTFHVTSTWRLMEGRWKVIFNMDQRIYQ